MRGCIPRPGPPTACNTICREREWETQRERKRKEKKRGEKVGSKVIQTYAADIALPLGRLLHRGLFWPRKSRSCLPAFPPAQLPSHARLRCQCLRFDREVGRSPPPVALPLPPVDFCWTGRYDPPAAPRPGAATPFPRRLPCAPAASCPKETPDLRPPRTAHGNAQAWNLSMHHHLRAAPGLLRATPPPTSRFARTWS